MIDPVTAQFVSTYTGAVLPTLIEQLTDIFGFFKKSEFNTERLQECENLLLIVEKVLADAEEKQITNQSVCRWVDNVRDVFYDAEDLLDEIKPERSRQSQLWKNLITNNNQNFNNRLEAVFKKLNAIKEQIGVLGWKEGHAWRSFPRLPTTSLVDKSSEKCLRNFEKAEIIDFLTKYGTEMVVVSIVGLSGIGKTTLAQFVYNDEFVQNHFDIRIWVHVSEEIDVFKVTKTINESFVLGRRSSEYDGQDLDLLQVTLESKLKYKKLLLVLDNVWNVSSRQWDLLCKPLQGESCQSRIILTTCSRNVSSIVRSALVHDLKSLSEDRSQFLFEEQVFGGRFGDRIWEEKGQEIVRKCGGLPLALKTLGDLLHSKVEAEEWDSILNSKIWDLPDDRSDILPALRLSYHYLPSQLKKCFAFCSIFPKGHEFEKLDLVRMWIAEGFVQRPNNERTRLEVGLQYFDELILRSIFQQINGDYDHPRFKMHDLVNDLAQHIAGEFVFKFEHDSPPPNTERVRYLSCTLEQSYKPEKFADFYGKNKVLRAFIPFILPNGGSTYFSSTVFNLFPRPSCLRVLSLSSYGSSITECPDLICKLKQLRYLDLSGAAISSLPKKMHKLYKLETLKLSDCRYLTHLPPKLSQLLNLEHLDIEGTKIRKMPPEVSDLKRIQLLTGFVVDSGSPINEVKDLCLLRTLSIVQLRNVKLEDAENANILNDKKFLRELNLDWSRWDAPQSNNTQNVQSAWRILNKLQPGKNLEKLIIKNFCGTDFPRWLGDASFSRMKFLTLEKCQKCTSLPPLGQLPSLKALTIKDLPQIITVGPEFYGFGDEVFKSLETLKFNKMPNWVQWSLLEENRREFKSLRELLLVQCNRLPKDDLPNQFPWANVHWH